MESNITLNMQGTSPFGKMQEISVSGHIAGKTIDACCYRVNCTNYTGRPYNLLLKESDYNGKWSSDGLTNPYKLKVIVPGYIAFWLVDTTNKIIYKSDFEYKELCSDTKNIDITFTKMN